MPSKGHICPESLFRNGKTISKFRDVDVATWAHDESGVSKRFSQNVFVF